MVSLSTKILFPGPVQPDRITLFIQKANAYHSNIKLNFDNRCINAKSLLGVMSLGLQGGQEISIIADGPDESEAAQELCKYWN